MGAKQEKNLCTCMQSELKFTHIHAAPSYMIQKVCDNGNAWGCEWIVSSLSSYNSPLSAALQSVRPLR